MLARLIDDDAKLSVRLAEGQAGRKRTAATRQRSGEQRRGCQRVRDELERKRELSQDSTIAGAAFARLELQLRAMDADVKAAAAEVSAMEAAERVPETSHWIRPGSRWLGPRSDPRGGCVAVARSSPAHD